MECEALKRVRDDMGLTNVQVMVPFVRTVSQAERGDRVAAGRKGLKRGENGLKIIMMCEVPSNAILAHEFLAALRWLLDRLERPDAADPGARPRFRLELLAHDFDERDPAVKALLKMAITACREPGQVRGHLRPRARATIPTWPMAGARGHRIDLAQPDSVIDTWQRCAQWTESPRPRRPARATQRAAEHEGLGRELNTLLAWFTLGVVGFIILLGLLEFMGMSRRWIGMMFLMGTLALYATIGILSRTTDAAEYYVAGRRVPAFHNGMATGADWMSAASFIGVAGTLYLTGYSGLAFIIGWTGGYCLVALLLAPYLRRFGQFTIPDFLGERYGGLMPRLLGIAAAILCSFVYVVAQIYGVGIVTARLTGVDFEVGIFLGLGGNFGVLFSRGHARSDLDAGGAVRHFDDCLPGTGGLAVRQADGRAHCRRWSTATSSKRFRPWSSA
jgi:hypothetical protein